MNTYITLLHVARGTFATEFSEGRSISNIGTEFWRTTVLAAIRSSSKPVVGDSALHIAKTAANRNASLATHIVDAFKRAGADGLIVVERTSLRTTELAVQEGMHFDRGYIDAGLVKSVAQENVLEDPYILLYDSKISSMRDFLPVLEQIAKSGAPLLIIADDVEGEALATLIVNRKRGTLNCIAVRSPGFADRRNAILQDIAALTGGTLVKVSEGRRLDGVTFRDLGRARKALVNKDSTTILGGASESTIGEYVETIRRELAHTKDPFETEKLRERLARLSGAIVTIRVGGISEQDIADQAYLAESAMHSLHNAIEQGTVVGGGVSLFHAKESLATLAFKRPGEVAGVQVLAEALEEPIRQLIINNGRDPAELVKRIKRSRKQGVGFNSETNDVQDLEAVGVLDPVGTVTSAIQLAFSHARTILQTASWDAAPDEVKKAARGRETVTELISEELPEE
jgi:chaperonin GroEL